jgi:hypothetical protein
MSGESCSYAVLIFLWVKLQLQKLLDRGWICGHGSGTSDRKRSPVINLKFGRLQVVHTVALLCSVWQPEQKCGCTKHLVG